jgi:hypothetical protein
MKRTRLFSMAVIVMALFLACSTKGAASSVVDHGFVPNGGFFTLLDPNNPNSTELVTFEVINTGNTSVLAYSIWDFGGGFSAAGSGTIPASSVSVSGGSVNTGNVKFTLNVNTCNVAGFTTKYGPCGTFNLTWVEMPASVGGSTISRGDFQQTSPGGAKVVINGNTVTYSALMAGTALGFAVPPSSIGALQKLTNVTLTYPAP